MQALRLASSWPKSRRRLVLLRQVVLLRHVVLPRQAALRLELLRPELGPPEAQRMLRQQLAPLPLEAPSAASLLPKSPPREPRLPESQLPESQQPELLRRPSESWPVPLRPESPPLESQQPEPQAPESQQPELLRRPSESRPPELASLEVSPKRPAARGLGEPLEPEPGSRQVR